MRQSPVCPTNSKASHDGVLLGLTDRFEVNHLLRRLPTDERHALVPYLGGAALDRGTVLGELGSQPECIWFPNTCVISLVVAAGINSGTTVGLIGREGAACEPAARQVVQIPGSAWFLSLNLKTTAVKVAPNLELLLLRHADALHSQVMQVAACNALHPAEARLARFLLSVADRTDAGTRLPLTQISLAHELGIQRATVSASAAAFQRMGLIKYRRGAMEIQDRTGLAIQACPCYNLIRSVYKRLLAEAW